MECDLLHEAAGAHIAPKVLGVELLREAGVLRGIAPVHPRRQALALAWLTGTLDDQVAVPFGFVCNALGLDAGVLAAAVRTRTALLIEAWQVPSRELAHGGHP